MVKVGSTLSATPASVTGDPTPVRSWQWLRDNVTISGATAADYYVQAADEGAKLSVRQIETNFVGVATATSAQTATVGAYDPGTLFESGEVGAWYDPSDLTTVFQDAAGTTPATVGDPVGLILDKSQGLATSNSGTAASSYTNYGWDVLTPDGSGGFSATKSAAGGTDYANTQETFNIAAGEVYRVTFTVTASTLTTFECSFGAATNLRSNSATFSGTGTKTAYLTVSTTQIGAQFRIHTTHLGSITVTGASWERVAGNHATQTTSAARPVLQQSGGLYYLDFDGVDDNLSTAAIDFTASDQMTTAAAVERQNSTAGSIAELSANWNSNAGTFLFFTGTATSGLGNGFCAASRGTAAANSAQFAYTTSIYTPPARAVLVASHDISDDYTKIRFDGTDSSVATGDKGLGNFSNQPIFFGSRGGGSSNLFDGLYFGIVIVNRTLTAAETDDLETYLAAKSGVTL